jgi:RHS repeat-associated protein
VFLLRNSNYLVSCCTKSDNVLRYHSFGSIMPGREYTSQSAARYRFGFNGKEGDSEIIGQGNQIAFEARIYDSRLGRFLSLDPKLRTYPWQTPFGYFKNCPLSIIDFKGMGDKQIDKQEDNLNESNIVDEGPDNVMEKIWWGAKLTVSKALNKIGIGNGCINVKDQNKDGLKVSTVWCGFESKSIKSGSPGRGPSSSGSGGIPALPPDLVLLADLNETTTNTSTFTIPKGATETGTMTISYSTSLFVGSGTLTDAVPNGITVTQGLVTPPPDPVFSTFGQILVNSPEPETVTVVPGQQFTVSVTTGVADVGVAAIRTRDRYYVRIKVTFP